MDTQMKPSYLDGESERKFTEMLSHLNSMIEKEIQKYHPVSLIYLPPMLQNMQTITSRPTILKLEAQYQLTPQRCFILRWIASWKMEEDTTVLSTKPLEDVIRDGTLPGKELVI